MMEQVYEDRWGEILDRPSIDVVEVRWFDTTADMTAPEFQAWLTKFAECVESCGRRRVLIDSTTFRMSPALLDGPRRDAHIISRCHAARVATVAFPIPDRMPPSRSPP